MAFAVFGFSVPPVIGYLLVFFFAVELRWFRCRATSLSAGILATLHSIVLPAVSLALECSRR